ncbi:MAG: hypothetical protein OJF49_002676 [Ktedonobacterales bacterium]|jgi:hypothetical protein|nr:MAG: hypothetical protein OJF49_002676 [Ktedonobacterales bacterium]
MLRTRLIAHHATLYSLALNKMTSLTLHHYEVSPDIHAFLTVLRPLMAETSPLP